MACTDEPDGSGLDAADFIAAYHTVKASDPLGRPVTAVFDTSHAQAFLDGVDVVMSDPYPVGLGDNVSSVASRTAEYAALAAKSNKSFWIVGQAFGSLESSWRRNPSRQEARVMIYGALMNGAVGVLLYARRAPSTMPTSTVLWGEFRALALELAEVQPFLLSARVSRTGTRRETPGSR